LLSVSLNVSVAGVIARNGPVDGDRGRLADHPGVVPAWRRGDIARSVMNWVPSSVKVASVPPT
jgi:hypothetical protein